MEFVAMAEAQSEANKLLALGTAAVIVGLIVVGLIWYGVSAGVFQRMWTDISDRPSGPMAFRFLLQPATASILAIRDGLQDARLGRSPYFWTVLSDPDRRWPRVQEGLTATGRVILLGLVMDAIYQYGVLGTFYPGEAALVAMLLAFLPYLLLRGLAARIARQWSRSSSGTAD
jgi:hypothetical protein